MAAQKRSPKTQSAPSSGETIEQRLTSFAEQLGALVGEVQNRAEELIDREAIGKEVERLKSSASELLDYVNAKAPSSKSGPRRKSAAKPSRGVTQPRSRGPVDAPGKRHRRPPPQERVSWRMSQPKGSQTAPVLVKSVRRGGRG